MPSVAVKLYSVYFKLVLKHKLQSQIQALANNQQQQQSDPFCSSFGITSRPDESTAPANPSFSADGVATKDIHIDPLSALSVRIFLPDSSLSPASTPHRRNSYGGAGAGPRLSSSNNNHPNPRRISCDAKLDKNQDLASGLYRGYSPASSHRSASRKLPVVIQFHGGAFVSGSNVSVANDAFCRRIAKLLDVVVIAVGYRLAPESRYPAAFEDGMKVLDWLRKQASLAECSNSFGGDRETRRSNSGQRIMDAFGAATVEPWLAAHGDPSRCVLLGVSCGANIADFVARKAVEAGRLMEPVNVVAQVLMYPFFTGSVPTRSELKLANSYFYDKAMCMLAWKLFLPEDEFSLDHPAVNPLAPGRSGPPLKRMPPTLTVVAEHDWMRDRAIAYSEELRKVNVDAPVLEYKDAVHDFATLDMLLRTPQAQACAEDIAIWVKKHISFRGHEFSY